MANDSLTETVLRLYERFAMGPITIDPEASAALIALFEVLKKQSPKEADEAFRRGMKRAMAAS